MTSTALRKFVLPSLITSGILFALMTVPLGMMGEEKVGIKFQEESLFDGRLRDVAAPYVILATVLSFGTGLSLAALAGWKHSTRKSLDYKNELSRVKENLELKEGLLQELHLSESRLQASGLNNFLEDQITEKNSQEVETSSQTVTQPVATQTSVSVPVAPQPKSSFVVIENPSDYKQKHTKTVIQPVGTQTSVFKPVAPQPESSFVIIENPSDYQQQNIDFQTNNNTTPDIEETAGSEFEELQRQFQDMMNKMQQMQQQMKRKSMYE
ncbi:MAG: hypothetical protein ACFB2X_12170 [Rivularia sp. (in: cyanobacteria)]